MIQPANSSGPGSSRSDSRESVPAGPGAGEADAGELAAASATHAEPVRVVLGGRYAVAWPTLSIYIVMTSFNNLTYDRGRLGGELGHWVLLSLLSCAAALIPMLIARATVLPVRERRARPGWALFSYVVSAAVRTGMLLTVGGMLGLIPNTDTPYRLWSPLAGTLLVMIGAEIVVTRFASYRLRSQQARATQQQLLEQQARYLAVAEHDREQIVAFAANALAPEIERVRLQLERGGVSTGLAPQLYKIVDEVVRPLSRQITILGGPDSSAPAAAHGDLRSEQQRSFGPRTRTARASTTRQPRPRVRASRLPLSLMIQPTVVAIVMAYVCAVRVAGDDQLLGFFWIVLPTIALNWGLLHLAKRLLRRVALPTPIAIVSAIVVTAGLALIAAALGSQLKAIAGIGSLPDQFSRLILLPMLATLIAASYQSVSLRIAERLAQSEAHSRELDLVTQRARQEMWLNRKRTSSHLHGPVQAALQVSAMRLARAERVDRELLDSIAAHIQSTLDAIDSEVGGTLADVERTCAELQEMWKLKATIAVELSPRARAVLAEDGPACQSVIEVVSEAVLNAVKHGDANDIAIALRSSSPGLLVLGVSNTGRPLATRRVPGFGSRTLDELCVAWEMRNEGDRTVLRAEIVAGDARGLGFSTTN